MVVKLDSQRAFVWRNGKLIGITTIASGKPGYETPDGTFTVLEKERFHRSNKYDDAPMPFMQRLTWSGLALHGGHPRGYPASHGCIRLPMGFAAALYKEETRGMKVVITGQAPGRSNTTMASRSDTPTSAPPNRTDDLEETTYGSGAEGPETACCSQAPKSGTAMQPPEENNDHENGSGYNGTGREDVNQNVQQPQSDDQYNPEDQTPGVPPPPN